jgi:hypothetical protein
MATKLKEFTLPIGLTGFLDEFWLDVGWYEKFLTEKLLDLSVEVEPWTMGNNPNVKSRKVKSFHPAKVSFPGLPSHAEVSSRSSVVQMCVLINVHAVFEDTRPGDFRQ